jgi:hypothetical protein
MAEEALTDAELEGLQELTKVGSIKKTIPENILDRLIRLNYAEDQLGGPVATSKGKMYAATHR